jgi:hypothetical protein
MRPTPPGWPRLSASVYYDDPKSALAWTDRSYGALDLEGHLWWFMQRLHTSPAQEKFGKTHE